MDNVFNVGDLVRIKSLDQLDMEFDNNEHGTYFTTGFSFTRQMHHLCGKEFHIAEIRRTLRGTLFFVSSEGIEWKNDATNDRWFITPSMVELLEEDADAGDIDVDAWVSIL